MDELKVQIKNDRIYAPLKRQWLKRTPEEEVRQDFICHLVNDYGYSLEQMEQEVTTTESSERGTGKARADIVIWANSNDKYKRKRALIVVECKAACVSITPKAYYQGFNYASWMHTKFLILTNQKETKFFKLNEEIVPQTFIDLEEIDDIPNAQQAKKYSGKVFSFYVPDGLLARDKEADRLFDGVINNRFFNLIGVGGSGKSSLTYLMMQKHESDFNEIAYVVVNNISIKEDIISQLNQFLKLEFGKDDNPYQKIVTYLEDNFRSSKPNLLVLDINELSNDVKDFVQNLRKLCPKDWKILFLSRENIDQLEIMEKEDLNHNQDTAFLKTLFLKRAGERYTNFADFNELFETIFYNPLLAEQLGFYLTRLPETKTLEQIKGILYGDKFKNKDMKGFATQTNDNRSTIIDFLTNLISYDSDTFDHNEKELLRHFILWPIDFINYKVIQELLKGVFESDDDLDETLGKLSDRAIFMTQTTDGGSLAYKLHGLLAESLRGQIDMSIDKYPTYEQNTKRNNTNDKDSVNVNICIYTSYCMWGEKMQDVTKGQYIQVVFHRLLATLLNDRKSALSHFYKSIEIGKKLPTNFFECQDELAATYTCFAYFLSTYLQDCKSANEYYSKAIIILEQISNNNPHYQNHLALTYNDCALLQQTYFGDFKIAKAYYQKAIEIGETITQNINNPQFLGTLALTYSNLGMLLQTYSGDCQSAEKYYKTAIEIGESFKDIYYFDTLALSYNNLGMVQQCYGNFQLAGEYYKKAIEIGESYIKEVKDSQISIIIALAYSNLGLLYQYFSEDIQFAEKKIKHAIKICELITKNTINPQYASSLAKAYLNLGMLYHHFTDDYQSAEENYKKAIEIGTNIVKFAKNPIFLYFLVISYKAIGALQDEQLEEYNSANEYYNKAIEIGEQLPKDNQIFQSDLASTYNDIGCLQHFIFKDYESARKNYNKAIEIREQLPQNNQEYQDDLAWTYHCLALVQSFDSHEYKSAKENLNKAIAIREQLTKATGEQQNKLALAYTALAYLLKNDYYNDYKSAKDYYQKAISIWEHLCQGKNTYLDSLSSAYNNLAQLQHKVLNDFKSAKDNFENAIVIMEQLSKDNPEHYKILASFYNNLAYLYKDGLKDYEAAKDICNKAIEIEKQLSITNPNENLNNWINYKHTLAEIYFDANEIDSAKSILSEIKPQAEKRLAENPNDEWTQTVNNDINDLLEKINQLQ